MNAIVGLVTIEALPLGNRLVDNRIFGVGLDIPVTGEAQPGFIDFQVGFTDQSMVAMTPLTRSLLQRGMNIIPGGQRPILIVTVEAVFDHFF